MFLVGIGSFIWKMIAELKHRQELSPVTLAGIMAFPIVGAAFLSPMWWSRYFFFPEFFLLFTIAMGFWFFVDWTIKRIIMITNI